MAAAGCALAAACSGVPGPDSPSPASRQDGLFAEHSTRPGRPARLVFRWEAREPDFRGRGSGVARVEPPYRARLDLFLDNGEAAAVAAVVGDELRTPAALPTALVPPPALFWAALGVFRPGDETSYVGGRRAEGDVTLEYELSSGGRLRYQLRSGSIVAATRLVDGSAVERVEVTLADAGSAVFPGEATYRHLADFRELRLRLESLEWVDAFPPDIWEFHEP